MPRNKRSTSPFELMDEDFDDTSSQSSRNGNPPIQRNAANARERARMRVLSSAFGRLKTKLPNIPADTKLSKLDTLRLATMYIKQLKAVVEGGAASQSTKFESMEKSPNNSDNNSTNFLNFNNIGVQSMNWPFGFHHHLSNLPLMRSTSSTSLINNSSSSNWYQRDNNSSEEQKEPALYETENCEHHQQQQQQTSSFINHTALTRHYNHQHNPWFSATPSPELDSTSSTCLTFENSHLQHQPEHQHQHQHHHNLSHLQPVATHSSTFEVQHHFHTQQQQSTAPQHHFHQNSFTNSQNFQATSIR